MVKKTVDDLVGNIPAADVEGYMALDKISMSGYYGMRAKAGMNSLQSKTGLYRIKNTSSLVEDAKSYQADAREFTQDFQAYLDHTKALYLDGAKEVDSEVVQVADIKYKLETMKDSYKDVLAKKPGFLKRLREKVLYKDGISEEKAKEFIAINQAETNLAMMKSEYDVSLSSLNQLNKDVRSFEGGIKSASNGIVKSHRAELKSMAAETNFENRKVRAKKMWKF